MFFMKLLRSFLGMFFDRRIPQELGVNIDGKKFEFYAPGQSISSLSDAIPASCEEVCAYAYSSLVNRNRKNSKWNSKIVKFPECSLSLPICVTFVPRREEYRNLSGALIVEDDPFGDATQSRLDLSKLGELANIPLSQSAYAAQRGDFSRANSHNDSATDSAASHFDSLKVPVPRLFRNNCGKIIVPFSAYHMSMDYYGEDAEMRRQDFFVRGLDRHNSALLAILGDSAVVDKLCYESKDYGLFIAPNVQDLKAPMRRQFALGYSDKDGLLLHFANKRSLQLYVPPKASNLERKEFATIRYAG